MILGFKRNLQLVVYDIYISLCLLCRLALFCRIQNYAEDREQLSPVEGNPIPSYHIVPAIL